MSRISGITLVILFSAGLCSQGMARAGEVKLLSALVMKPALAELAASFERTSGHKLAIAYDSAGAVTKRIQSAEAADVVIKWHTFPVAVSRKVRPYPQPDVINPKGASLADTRAEQTSFGTY